MVDDYYCDIHSQLSGQLVISDVCLVRYDHSTEKPLGELIWLIVIVIDLITPIRCSVNSRNCAVCKETVREGCVFGKRQIVRFAFMHAASLLICL